MVDPTTPAAPPASAPAPNVSTASNSGAPTTQSNPNTDPTKVGSTPPGVTTERGVRAGTEGGVRGVTDGNKSIARGSAGLITNPAPIVDPDAPVKEELPASVPQSTLDEMAAGKKALERNRPVATALENAKSAKDAGVSTTPETNPVDATHSLQQQGKV